VPPASGEIDPAIMARYLQAACDADDAAHGYVPLGEPTGAAAPAPPPGTVGGAGGIPPSVPSAPTLFERSPYIELSFDSRQLKAIRRYIRLNPARKLWRLAHPDLFRRMTGLRHPFLDSRKNPDVAHAFRRNCLAMNDLAAALCAAASTRETT